MPLLSPAHGPRPAFSRIGSVLHCEDVNLADLAERLEGPAYVYSRRQIEENFTAWERGFSAHPHLVCYAVKANPTRGILTLLARLGAGFDTVSIGEVERALRAGADPKKIVFSGVGKSERELERAVDLSLYSINVESESELLRLMRVTERLRRPARISLRCNPNVNPNTHPYISTGLLNNKFGIPMRDVPRLYRLAHEHPWLEPVGIDCHIGSQITTIGPFTESVDKLLDMVELLRSEGIRLTHLDIGGGLGIVYTARDRPPEPAKLVEEVRAHMTARNLEDLTLLAEPGRSIVGNAGVLLTKVEYIKTGPTKTFCIVDAAMTDLIRPALYDAWMAIEPVVERAEAPRLMDVVGPVCESTDVLGKNRELAIREGDFLAIFDAGAYGASMASNYNSRALPMEYLVDGEQVRMLRIPQTWRSRSLTLPARQNDKRVRIACTNGRALLQSFHAECGNFPHPAFFVFVIFTSHMCFHALFPKCTHTAKGRNYAH